MTLQVLGSRGASAGKLSGNSDEISRVGEEACSPRARLGHAGRSGGSLEPFTFVVPKAGVYGYYCALHVASAKDDAWAVGTRVIEAMTTTVEP